MAMLLELLVILHPMYFLHVIHSLIAGIIYLIFSLIYYGAGGTDNYGNNYIYKILDWNKPGATSVIVILVAIFIIILHIIACTIQILRFKFHKLLTKNQGIYSI